MAQTLVEKILSAHAGRTVRPGEIADIRLDARVARDFGGANVVKNLSENGLGVADPDRTFFTFDCNPGGSDQGYAANQHLCREFARAHGIRVFDIDAGIGTHLAVDLGLIGPGQTFVSTDSHANILGAIGAFGQGMGDMDIAHAFARGTVWLQVPPTIRVTLRGTPSSSATAKDLTLACLRAVGSRGLLGCAAEFGGEAIESLDLAGRMTLCSMVTEMGGIIGFVAPNPETIAHCRRAGAGSEPVFADPDAEYEREVVIDVDVLGPLVSRPGKPHDVVALDEEAGRPVDSVFIGSCTNGRLEDLHAAAEVLRGKRIAPGVVLKVVPATNAIWMECLRDGTLEALKNAGALVANAGCAGCAAGQVGQNGPGEVTVSTGNRNFPGKQGKGEVYLASPRTAAASALAGALASADGPIPSPAPRRRPVAVESAATTAAAAGAARPTELRGRVWVVDRDDIDTDMIFHNSHLAITRLEEMGPFTFGNLPGWEHFSRQCEPGDIVVTGANFGCGSSRQQAVDCFTALGVALIIAESFGAIYERNAINAGLAVLRAPLRSAGLRDGDVVVADLATGRITLPDGSVVQGRAFPEAQMAIYRRGGLLAGG